MSDETKKDYEIGYCRTPKHTRFQKGTGGNRKGRIAGSKNLATDLSDELNEIITIKENGKDKRVRKQRALVKRVINSGIQGNERAAATVFNAIRASESKIEARLAAASEQLDADDREIIRAAEKRLLRKHGLEPRDEDDKGEAAAND